MTWSASSHFPGCALLLLLLSTHTILILSLDHESCTFYSSSFFVQLTFPSIATTLRSFLLESANWVLPAIARDTRTTSMSKHRVKNVGYDDDDYYSDDGYDSPDPEEQEFLQQCTSAVLEQLRAGQPSVTATKEEVQDALWHYYNDIEKSVNYLRGTSSLVVLRQRAFAEPRPRCLAGGES